MVASENPPDRVDPLRGYASQELSGLLDRYEARSGRFAGARSGASREDDPNPFILRDYGRCISCYRCVRVCAEQEGDHAIHIAGRGFPVPDHHRVLRPARGLGLHLLRQCVQTCPTGALADRKAMRAAELPGPIGKTRSVCPYCGVAARWTSSPRGPAGGGAAGHGRPRQPGGPVRQGAVRLRLRAAPRPAEGAPGSPRGRGAARGRLGGGPGPCRPGFAEAAREHGPRAVYGIASGRTPSEANYLMQKLIRAGFGTHQIDNCSRA